MLLTHPVNLLPERHKRIYTTYLLYLIAMTFNASAQTPSMLHFQSFTINNGLSQGYISSITQDKKGLMWFATGDGLNKYDGYNVTVYHHDPDDTTSLSSDDLTCVFEDSKGRLWIGTRQNGLNLFDRETGTFAHIRHSSENSLRSNYIMGIKEDTTGALWIRTRDGIDRLEIVTGKSPPQNMTGIHALKQSDLHFTHIRLDSAFEAEKHKYEPENIFIDSRNHILLTTNQKVLELLYDSQKRTYDLVEKFSFAITDSSFITEIVEDPTDHSLLLNRKQIIRFSNYDFSKYQVLYNYNTTLQVRFAVDKTGMLWMNDGHELTQINLKTGHKHTVVPQDISQMDAINSTTNFYSDRTGIVWIGTGGYGIIKFDPQKELFHHILRDIKTYQLLESKDSEIITNDFKAVLIKKGQHVEVSRFVDSAIIKKKFPRIGVLSFTKDTSGNLWMGIHGGVIKYNIVTQEVTQFNLPFRDFISLPFPVYMDKANNLWMGYNRYFVRYSLATGKFSRYDYPAKTLTYDYDFLQSIYEDDGKIWLGSINGLFCFDPAKEKIAGTYFYQPTDSTSLSNNFVFCFAKDIQHPFRYLWIGTKGGGLNRLDKMTGKFTRYNTKNGLANNVIYGMLSDSNGNLWLSTNKGLSFFNLDDNSFTNFDVSDGLQGNEFNRYAYCKTKDGLLVFGGMNGVNYFDPNEIKPLDPPEVIFTEFRLFNRPVKVTDPNSPLKKEISYTDEVTLKYEQNVVTMQFAAMDFRKQGNVRYRYRMEGFDKDWIYSGQFHEATYTNLDPGDYRFIVQASFKNGEWGTKETALSITVVPPWYRTWWFYLLTVTATVSITYALYKFRLYQLRRLERLRNRIARDLHDEVGSSISTIAIYSKIVHEQADSDTFNKEPLLKKITDFASEIMESMNDIVWNINTKNDAFEHIINRMREHAYQLLEAKGYTLHFNFDEHLYRTKLEMEKRRDFYLIYKEALNNIAKYAEGENVWITLVIAASQVHLTIKDDGKGFDMDAVKRSSNGLVNMSHRAATLNGKISITSNPGEGTEICLSFSAV